MIIKLKEYPNMGYTTILNDTIRDNNLSLSAKGLLIYMLSCKDDWNFALRTLCNNTNSSRRTIENALKELTQRGYVKYKTQNRDKGRFGHNEYIVSETPILNDYEPI